MPLTDLLKAKINHGFAHLDVDGDGLLTEQDHVLMGRRAAEVLGHASGSAEEQRIVDAYVDIWRDLHEPHIPDGGQAINREQFLASTSSLADDPQAASATVGAIARAFLAIADTDADGNVSPAEFRKFQLGHFPNLTEEESAKAFNHLDLDSDGLLTAEEFVRACVDYWTSTDPDSPGNWWAGRALA
ncbi:EF-hand domain-containing protein [Lentzea sp. CC55]|uniref:EF-hand domain-containing protein n=1 Tax=Lentzea sp. CC55 TaxID=2884909 RepID=UPI0027E1B26A|nr:EF-hand domain-containing protein [Lentzea sp. CC55]MCG8924999.1 EF-hand domain-containing protein [Lentzea sp. CC55]